MLELIERIRSRLGNSAYVNEAAISHGIVTPLLNALGWDSADPDQLVPEYSIPQRGRVDFALLGLGGRPAVFIEVKGVGRALDGDRQLFEYCFHHGVPLCVLTDGRTWSFFVPAGQGSYDDRRVYLLQLDDREPVECQRILTRYLAHDRVRDGSAFEDAQRDHRDAAGKREATAVLPRAWADLASAPEDLLIDLLCERTEALCGYRPAPSEAARFLQRLKPGGIASPAVELPSTIPKAPAPSAIPVEPIASDDRSILYRWRGEERHAPNASVALVDILRSITALNPDLIPTLADAVRGRSRNLIAGSPEEINPLRPDLARGAEFAPGWLVSLTISNKTKMGIIRAACEIFGLRMPGDLEIELPNT